jgi:hypothetical protein
MKPSSSLDMFSMLDAYEYDELFPASRETAAAANGDRRARSRSGVTSPVLLHSVRGA